MAERILGIGREADAGRRGVLLQAMDMARAGDWDDEWAPRQQPGERELRRGAALGRGMRLQFLDQAEIALQVLRLETRHAAACIALAQPVEARHAAGQKAAPERAVGDKADAELLAKRQHLGLDITSPQ